MDKCLICGSKNYKQIYSSYPGYVENTFFNIFKCLSCDAHFIFVDEELDKLYNTIYSSNNTSGYDRYYKYAIAVKDKTEPLKYLAFNESTYYPVYNFLKDKRSLKILEIGCGYGYLSYSMKKMGFDVTGIDIAEGAIAFAKENFGDFYHRMSVEDFLQNTKGKFDLIVATEVIEHIQNPNNFLSSCTELLNNNGHIILTTPDKDYSRDGAIWQTDLPPVHISWIGRKGMESLAKNHNLNVTFQNFSKYYSGYENRLVKYIVNRKEILGQHLLTKEGFPKQINSPSVLHRIIAFMLHKVKLVRDLSNLLYNMTIGKEITLGAIFTWKNKSS